MWYINHEDSVKEQDAEETKIKTKTNAYRKTKTKTDRKRKTKTDRKRKTKTWTKINLHT